MRRLSKLFVILCLAIGGSHDALAAALCAHFECESRARVAAAAHTTHGAGAASHEAHPAAAPPRHCGARAANSETRHEAATTDAHDDAAAAAHHARVDEARASATTAGAVARTFAESFALTGANCRHCAGRPAPAPAALTERRADGPRRTPHLAPPAALAVASHPRLAPSPAARLAPTQHAPPRTVPRYILLNVFLI